MIDRTVFPLRRRKHARPRELLIAALDLFIEKGFAATRTEEIAARAGVSKGTLYLYFDSKEDLLSDLIAQRFFCQFPFERRDSTEARAGLDLLRDVVIAWRSTLIEGHAGGVVKLVFTEVHNFPGLAEFWVREVMTPTRVLVSSIVQRGIERSEFRAVDPDLVVNALVLPIIATCLHRHAIGPYVPCEFIAADQQALGRYFELVLEGLMDRPAERMTSGRADRASIPMTA
ncbi:MAG TPA: TetR/AcrR family transcriptional regulator [Burkholderiaceae bacterium]|nr:TetR/AcrR family transcriptional regulator [Burkholderiaceae bacterium]